MSVNIFFIDNNQHSRWYHFRTRKHRKIINFLQSKISQMHTDDDIFEGYPWCFVYPTHKKHPKKYYVGALVVSQKANSEKTLCLMFSRLSYNNLSTDFKKDFHLAFWQSRILSYSQSKIETDNKKNVSLWVNALRRCYSPVLESIFIRRSHRFVSTSDFLLSNLNILDKQTSINSGVPFMPWKNWPECVQSGNFVWLWRQSRFGRIIDSKKVTIPMDVTNAHR